MKAKIKKRSAQIAILGIAAAAASILLYLLLALVLADDQRDMMIETPGTDVWLTVIPRPTEERVSVTVPIAFAFVVNGTADSTDNTEISTENGSLLIPNIKVKYQEGKEEYQVTVEGEPTMVVRNYSTNIPDDELDSENPPRYGIKIDLSGSIQTPGESSERGAWTPVGGKPGTDIADHKRYRLVVDEKPFSIQQSDGTFAMDGSVTIGAPPSHLFGWTAGGISAVPFEQEVKMNVEVGGTRSMYQDIESSIKVGQIIWKIKTHDLPDDLPELGPGAGQVKAARQTESSAEEGAGPKQESCEMERSAADQAEGPKENNQPKEPSEPQNIFPSQTEETIKQDIAKPPEKQDEAFFESKI